MTRKEAENIIREFDQSETPMGEDFFLYTEAMDLLIREDNSSWMMLLLALEYSRREKYDAARKYFEIAAALGEPMAIESLGNIFYYGHGVKKNLKIAYDYAKQAYETNDKWGSFFGTSLLAKIYADECYKKRDIAKSRRLLESLVARAKDDEELEKAAITDFYEELADIYMAEGEEDRALELYLKVKNERAEVLTVLTVPDSQADMIELMDKLQNIASYQPETYDLYDLYWLLKRPAKVRFGFDGDRYFVESFIEDGEMRVRFCGEDYQSVADFIQRAKVNGTRIEALYFELEEMEVVG